MNINKILEYHHEKQKLTHILTTHIENILQNLRYDYDGFSNLASRKDEERDMEETFTYDHLNRLTGGRELVFQYGNTMGELLKDGINPGYPAYQPFK